MSQEDLIISAQPSGVDMRTEINGFMEALASFSSGATPPTTPYANQFYFNETTEVLWKRDSGNTAWERAPLLPKPVATTAAMSALDGSTYPSGQVVLVLAGATAGDELGGWFEARASGDTVDGVSVFTHDAGGSLRWHRIVPTPAAASLPSGVEAGATDALGRFKITAQDVSGELIDFYNFSDEFVARVASTSSGQAQFLVYEKGTNDVRAGLTGEYGLILGEYGTLPGTPVSGRVYIYPKSSDSRLYMKNDAGVETVLTNDPLVITGVTGALTKATHSGNVLVTSGDVTVPNAASDVGFNATIVAGGAHTVTFNSTTSAAMAAGDMMKIIVQSTTVKRAILTPVADQEVFT
jgi:hypothetical protein